MSEFSLSPPSCHIGTCLIFVEYSMTIYDCYPRKVGKRKALVEIERAIRRLMGGEFGPRLSMAEAVDGLLKSTALYARSPAGNRESFTPHPSTWFHQSRYLDNPDEWFHQTEDERLRSLNHVGVYRP